MPKKTPKKIPKKDNFKYYNLTFRHRKEVNKGTLKVLEKVVWDFFGDISIIDVQCKKVNKPQGWVEE